MLETIIVLVVLAILAAIVYPRFNRVIEVTYGRDALVNLELMLSANKIIKMQTGSMLGCTGVAVCNTTLNLELSADNWDYRAFNLLGVYYFMATRQSDSTIIVINENTELCPAQIPCTWPYINSL